MESGTVEEAPHLIIVELGKREQVLEIGAVAEDMPPMTAQRVPAFALAVSTMANSLAASMPSR